MANETCFADLNSPKCQGCDRRSSQGSMATGHSSRRSTNSEYMVRSGDGQIKTGKSTTQEECLKGGTCVAIDTAKLT